MKGKRFVALLLALMMVFALAACGDSDTNTNPAGPDGTGNPGTVVTNNKGESTLYMNIKGDPQGFDVWTGSGAFQLKYLVYETLFTYDYTNSQQPNPNIFASCELSDDRMGMTLVLNDDVYTQNGYKFVAQDVIWSLQMGLGASSSRFVKVFDVENCRAIDEKTVYLACADKWVDFNYDSCAMIYLASQEAYEASEDHYYYTGLAGTGPYMVESYTEGNEVILVKNPNYVDRGSDFWGGQNIDRIVCKVISESSQALIEYETGTIDFVTQPDLNDLDFYGSLDDTEVISSLLNKNLAVLNNCSEKSVLNNVLVRQAIAYAIDNETICNQALKGLKVPATGVTNPVCATWDDSMYDKEYYSIDTAKAKALLKEAGYENGLELKLCYSTGDGAYMATIASVIQNELAAVGITVSIEPYDNASATSLTSGEEGWDMYLTTYKITGNAMFHFWNLCNTKKKDYAFWGNSEFQALLDEALYTQDPASIEKMVEMYEEELPMYIVAYETTQFILRDGVEDVRFKGNNWYFPNDWDFSGAEWAYD